MNEVEKFKAYIFSHELPKRISARCNIEEPEIVSLADIAALGTPCDAVLYAFLYGRAKGYRAGYRAGKRKEATA